MRNNGVSIRLLQVPNVLGTSDLDNRSSNKSNQVAMLSKNNMESTNDKQQNTKQLLKVKSQVKYFSRISTNLSPTFQAGEKFKKSFLMKQQKLNFDGKKRKSAEINGQSVVDKYLPRPTEAMPTNDKFKDIIRQALIRQQRQKLNPKQIDTDSDEQSCKRISSKKMLNCFTIDQFQKGMMIGKGQFGQVFIVRHKQTGFVCAMKILDKQYIKKQKLQIQLARQIKLHSTLKHPNINAMYGYSWDRYNIYLLLQLCSDGEVFKILKKRRRTSQKQASYIIKQMVQAVYYLHSHNIIHRDLKPQNMIMHQGIIKVIDFGWATDYKGKHRTTLCGTPLYYSPQMVKKQSYDFTVDLWAIGIMAYELLIGNVPFSIWTQMQLHKIVEDQIKFPTYVDVSPQAKSFILSILQKNPHRRMKIQEILKHDFLKNVDVMAYIDLFAEE